MIVSVWGCEWGRCVCSLVRCWGRHFPFKEKKKYPNLSLETFPHIHQLCKATVGVRQYYTMRLSKNRHLRLKGKYQSNKNWLYIEEGLYRRRDLKEDDCEEKDGQRLAKAPQEGSELGDHLVKPSHECQSIVSFRRLCCFVIQCSWMCPCHPSVFICVWCWRVKEDLCLLLCVMQQPFKDPQGISLSDASRLKPASRDATGAVKCLQAASRRLTFKSFWRRRSSAEIQAKGTHLKSELHTLVLQFPVTKMTCAGCESSTCNSHFSFSGIFVVFSMTVPWKQVQIEKKLF